MNKNKIFKLFTTIIISLLFVLTINNNVWAAKKSSSSTPQVSTTGENLIYNDPVYIAKHNNNLGKLEIAGYELNPMFNKNTTTYYIQIDDDVESLDISCETEEEGATYTISGNAKLNKKTENKITIKVKSKVKTTKTYTINTSRKSKKNLKLSSLSIEGCELSPTFDGNKFFYSTEITTDKIQKLNINAETQSSSAEVEIVGNNDEMKYGDNFITIIVKDSSETTTYQIKVSIIEQTFTTITEDTRNSIQKWFGKVYDKIKEFLSDENNKLSVLIGIAVLLFLLVIIFARKVIKRKKRIREE
jgi:hypothetical protein